MTAIDTALPSLTIVKSFVYRGDAEEWSNTYFMNGDLPASPTSWKHLADLVIAQEKTLYGSTQEVVRAGGHKAGESVAVWGYDYLGAGEEVPGTYGLSGATPQGGDSASWIRWSTDALTTKGKPIYLRSYYHPCYVGSAGLPDIVATSWKTAAQAFGDAWVAGFADGDGVTHHRAGPHGVVGQVALPSEWATTRTLERRGRRPTTP